MIPAASSYLAERRAMEQALQAAAVRRRHEQLAAVLVSPVIAGLQTVKRGKRSRVTLPALRCLGERP